MVLSIEGVIRLFEVISGREQVCKRCKKGFSALFCTSLYGLNNITIYDIINICCCCCDYYYNRFQIVVRRVVVYFVLRDVFVFFFTHILMNE